MNNDKITEKQKLEDTIISASSSIIQEVVYVKYLGVRAEDKLIKINSHLSLIEDSVKKLRGFFKKNHQNDNG